MDKKYSWLNGADEISKNFNKQIQKEKQVSDYVMNNANSLEFNGFDSSIALSISFENKITPSEIYQQIFNLTFEFKQDDWKKFRTEKYWNNIDKINSIILKKRYTLFCVKFYIKNML
jgi:hypothetical protein